MRAFDVSIETSHIYAHQNFSEEHRISLGIAHQKMEAYRSAGHTVAIQILLDDPHSPVKKTNEAVLLKKAAKLGADVSQVVLESSLTIAAMELFSRLPKEKLRAETFRKEQKEVLFLDLLSGRIPVLIKRANKVLPSCSLLSAAFVLARLGESNFSRGIIPAYKVITVLEERFQNVERNAHTLLSASPYRNALRRVEVIYFSHFEYESQRAA